MRAWKKMAALALVLLLSAVCAAEGMTLQEEIAAAEEEVLQWYEMDGTVAEADVRAAVEYLLDRGGAMFENAGELAEDEIVPLAQAVTYLEQACARVAVGVTSPAVRLCSAVRTGVEQLYKQGLPWAESGVENYAVAFDAAAEEIEADMDGVVASLCDRGATLRTRLEEAEAEVAQWLSQGGEIAREELERAIAYLQEHAAELEKDISEVSDEVAEELTRALVCVEAALDAGMTEAGEALGDMAEQVRQGVDALWKEGKTWAEAGMDEVKAAYEAARDAVKEGWQDIAAAIGELFS